MGSTPSPLEVIRNLVNEGWIPLRQLAVLLNYKQLRAIYARQRGRNPIPTIRVGGIERVYADDVLEVIQSSSRLENAEARALISLYQTGRKQKERKEKHNA